MGVRGELFSTRVILPNRTYFFNVKENRLGDLYLNIVESKNQETGGFERQSVIVFSEDLPVFLGEFDKALKVLEKSIREQKRGGGKRRDSDLGNSRDHGSNRDEDAGGGESSGRPKRSAPRAYSGESRPRRGSSLDWTPRDRETQAGERKRATFRKDEGARSGYSGGKARAGEASSSPRRSGGESSFRKDRDSGSYTGSRAKPAGRGKPAEDRDKSRGGKRVVVKKTRRD